MSEFNNYIFKEFSYLGNFHPTVAHVVVDGAAIRWYPIVRITLESTDNVFFNLLDQNIIGWIYLLLFMMHIMH